MLAALLTNLNKVPLLSDVSHAVHNLLEVLEISQVSWGSGCFIERFKRWLCSGITIREHSYVVLVVSDNSGKSRFTSPDCRKPILEGFEASLNSDVPGASCVLLDVLRGVSLEVFEGQLGKLAADDDFPQVRDLLHHLLQFVRGLGEGILLDLLGGLLELSLKAVDQAGFLCLGLLDAS